MSQFLEMLPIFYVLIKVYILEIETMFYLGIPQPTSVPRIVSGSAEDTGHINFHTPGV